MTHLVLIAALLLVLAGACIALASRSRALRRGVQIVQRALFLSLGVARCDTCNKYSMMGITLSRSGVVLALALEVGACILVACISFYMILASMGASLFISSIPLMLYLLLPSLSWCLKK